MSAPEIINPGAASGGAPVGGSGTPGKLAKFTGAGTSIGDSLLSESGTTITSAATAETFGSAQTWTVGAPNSQALVVLSNAGAERTLVLDTISRAVGVGVPTTPATLLHVSDGVTTFAGTAGAGVRLDRATEALFSSSDGTRSFRAGLTGGTAVVGTSTAHDLLLQRNNVTAATLQSGAIASVTLTAGGAGYTNGTYSQQALTGGTGTGATADIVVAGGIVTSCVVRSPGSGYTAADALSCAVIGAGAGFVVTVATIAQIVAGSGNVTALGRIGAGTATPIATLDSVGLSAFRAAGLYQQNPTSYFGPVTTATFSQAVFDSSGETSGLTVVPATTSQYNAAIFVAPRFDASLRTSTTSLYGAFLFPTVESAAPGATTAIYGVQATPTVNSTSITGRTLLLRGIIGISSVRDVGIGNTVSQMTGLYGYPSLVSTNPVAVTAAYGVHVPGIFATGAAHTFATYYGLRLQTGTLSGGATITNNWGISQEDTLANNYFAGNVGIGTTSPTKKLDVNGAANITGALTVAGSVSRTSGSTAGVANGAYIVVAVPETYKALLLSSTTNANETLSSLHLIGSDVVNCNVTVISVFQTTVANNGAAASVRITNASGITATVKWSLLQIS